MIDSLFLATGRTLGASPTTAILSRCAAALFAAIVIGILAPGCGFTEPTFPLALRNGEGEPILFNTISEIVNDASLSDEEKSAALRDLGIDGQEFIDLFLTLDDDPSPAP